MYFWHCKRGRQYLSCCNRSMAVKCDSVLQGPADKGMWKCWKMKCAAEQTTANLTLVLTFLVHAVMLLKSDATKLHRDVTLPFGDFSQLGLQCFEAGFIVLINCLFSPCQCSRLCPLITLSTFLLAFAWTNKLKSVVFLNLPSTKLQVRIFPDISPEYKTLHILQIQATILLLAIYLF